MKVLVTGATGAVGPAVVDALLRDGNEVRALVRRDISRSDIDVVRGDVTDSTAVLRAADGVDAIVHLAAVLHEMKITPAIRAAYVAVNVGGTENVVRTGTRVIFASTIAVYGYNRGIPLTEEATLAPDSDYARSKVAAEEIVRRAGGTILRFGAVYGARVKGNYRRLVRSLQRGRFIPIGNGHNRRSVIYDEDAATAVVAALRSTRTTGETYNIVHPYTPMVKEIIAAICKALGRKPPRFRIPAGPIRPLLSVAPAARAMLDKYLEDVVVLADKIKRDAGFVAHHDIDAGWLATVRALLETSE